MLSQKTRQDKTQRASISGNCVIGLTPNGFLPGTSGNIRRTPTTLASRTTPLRFPGGNLFAFVAHLAAPRPLQAHPGLPGLGGFLPGRRRPVGGRRTDVGRATQQRGQPGSAGHIQLRALAEGTGGSATLRGRPDRVRRRPAPRHGAGQWQARACGTPRGGQPGPRHALQRDLPQVVDERERQQVFHSLAGHPVLSISERGTECSVGSMFCLNVGGPRITFEANLDSIARSGVRVHPSVLKLARRQATP